MFLTEGVRLDRGLRMVRIARVAASGYPHHVTQRGVHLNAHRQKLVLCPRNSAGHYGFTAEELDFILNYDIKYRLGGGGENEEE